MDLDSGKNSTQGSSSTKDGATSYSACSSASVAGLRPRTAEPGSGMPAWRKGLNVALPAVRLLVITSAGCGQLQRAGLGQGSFQRISSPPRAHPASRTECAGTAEDGREAGHRHGIGAGQVGIHAITRSGLGRRWNWRWTSLRAVRVAHLLGRCGPHIGVGQRGDRRRLWRASSSWPPAFRPAAPPPSPASCCQMSIIVRSPWVSSFSLLVAQPASADGEDQRQATGPAIQVREHGFLLCGDRPCGLRDRSRWRAAFSRWTATFAPGWT